MAWINSDDKYHPLAFAKVASVFMSYPDIQWLTGRTNLWNENGNLFCVADSLSVFSRRKFLELNFGKPCIQQESTFWKRSLWEQAGGTLDADASLAGDLELWLRFFRYASIYTVDTFLGGYRRNDGQRGVLYAQEYLEESVTFIQRELALCQMQLAEMPAPPPAITLQRNQLSAFLNNYEIKKCNPNQLKCWCEYTEDLLFMTNLMLENKCAESIQFWLNEVSLFSLIKPRAAVLLSNNLNSLSQLYGLLNDLLLNGNNFVSEEKYEDALLFYRGKTTSSNICNSNGKTTFCLWKMGQLENALGLLPEILKQHVHNSAVVATAVKILIECNATRVAEGLCEEYLSTDPHSSEIASLLKRLKKSLHLQNIY